jgi:hypothetical protein
MVEPASSQQFRLLDVCALSAYRAIADELMECITSCVGSKTDIRLSALEQKAREMYVLMQMKSTFLARRTHRCHRL